MILADLLEVSIDLKFKVRREKKKQKNRRGMAPHDKNLNKHRIHTWQCILDGQVRKRIDHWI